MRGYKNMFTESMLGPVEEKKEVELSPIQKFTSELIVINKAAREGNFMDAYKTVDEMRNKVRSRGYNKEDRSFVQGKLIQLLVDQYGDRIKKLYDKKIEQFRKQNDLGLSFSRNADGYPRRRGQTGKDYMESYYRKKAIDEINEMTKDYRYGAYMHKVIDIVLNPEKYEYFER